MPATDRRIVSKNLARLRMRAQKEGEEREEDKARRHDLSRELRLLRFLLRNLFLPITDSYYYIRPFH